MYELVGDDYVVDVDNKVVRGTMVLGGTELGIEWEVRTGGPAIGFSPVSQHMAVDDSIQLGYASTDQQINHWDVAPLMSVVAPLERNPQMVMWDPGTLIPNIDGIADLGEAGCDDPGVRRGDVPGGVHRAGDLVARPGGSVL